MNLRSIIWLTFISTFLLFMSSNVNASFGSYAACAGACGTAYHTCMGVSILSTYAAGKCNYNSSKWVSTFIFSNLMIL